MYLVRLRRVRVMSDYERKNCMFDINGDGSDTIETTVIVEDLKKKTVCKIK